MAVAQAVRGGLQGHERVQGRVGRPDGGHAALRAVAAVAIEGAPELQGTGLAAGDVARHGITGVRRQELALIALGDIEQLLVRGVGLVGDIDRIDQLLRVVTLQQRIVEAQETPLVSQLGQRGDRLRKDAVAIPEDADLGPVVVDALGEDHERPDGVALVVGPLGEVAVGREEVVQLTDETASFSALVRAVEGPIHQIVVAHRHTDHTHGGRSPGAVVVHLVEHLVIGRIPVHAVHDEVGNGTEQVPPPSSARHPRGSRTRSRRRWRYARAIRSR